MDTLKYPTPQALMEDTCNAIREKDGTSEKIYHQDVPDRIRAIPSGGDDVDLSGVTAKSKDVSEHVQFIDSSGKLDYGTMPEIADETVTLDGNTTEHDIEEGHHTGGGKVKIVPDTLYLAPSFQTQEITSPDGKVYTKVILDPIPDTYTDVSGANATPAQVLQGSSFVGAKGSVEKGGIEIRSGKRFTVTTNGLKSISSAYYDSSAYFEVDVPQEIVSGSGEDSTGTSAVAADIRKGKTARSKGSLVTGTMPDVDAPPIAIAKNFSTTGGKRKLLASASSAATESGYLARGKSANNSLGIPVYCAYNGDNMTITPGKTVQYFKTAGKYLEDNLKVEAVESDGLFRAYVDTLEYTGTDSITIPLSSFAAYSTSKFIRLYIHCLESYDSYNVVSSYAYITSEHQILTYYNGDHGKYRVDHGPEISVEFNSKSITLWSNDQYYFNGRYEICVVCKA